MGKSKQSEKDKTKDLEEVGDFTKTELKGLETNSTLREEKKKKKKQKVGHDVGIDNSHDEIKNEQASVDVYRDLSEENNIKKKKRKIEFGEAVTNSEAEAVIGVEVDDSQKDQKKKKRRKLESGEKIDDLGNKTSAEEKGALQTDDRRVKGEGNELKTRKDKKKQHEKERDKDVTDTVIPSSEIENKDIMKIKNGEDGVKKSKSGSDIKGVKELDNETTSIKKSKSGSDIKGVKEKKKTKDNMSAKDSGGDVSQEVEKNKKKEKKKGEGDGVERNLIKELDNETTSIREGNELKTRKDKKKRHEREREKDVTDDTVIPFSEIEKEGIIKLKNGEDGVKEKKKNKAGSDIEDVKEKKKTKDGISTKDSPGNVSQEVEKNKKKEKKKDKGDLGDGLELERNLTKQLDNTSNIGDKKSVDSENDKKEESKKNKPVEKDSENPKAKEKSKRVSFSGNVEVFPPDNKPTRVGNTSEDGLVRAKRFTPEEDELIKESIHNYIKVHGLGEKGLNMVLHCRSYPEVKNCWKEIGAAIPYRPYTAIIYRAHCLFERSESRGWTEEEYELIRKHHEKYGNNWKSLADELGKHRVHVKDTWRRIKLPNLKKGHWDQGEYQKLFELVNKDLQMKAFEEKKSKHGMLRDNICWSAISDKLSTRTIANCCIKWYGQLTSPMVEEGKWSDVDDYRLLDALFKLDACCVEDVDWDSLIEHRPGDVCLKRWNQMVFHIGQHATKSFSEQVDILANRYCPDLIEARNAWDNKPVVP